MRRTPTITKALLLSGVGIGSLGFTVAAQAEEQAQPETAAPQEEAQDEFDDDFDDNVIIVTASKRETTLQETPISVSVTSGETLDNAVIRDVLDLQTVTPSLRVSQLQNSSNTTFIIRGFGNGDNNFGIEPSVGVFVDGVFRSRSIGGLGDLANLERVEVLRGPQSTLFGKNASAGVISIVTRAPQFDFGGNFEVAYGNFNQFIVKGDITGPITDTLAFSVDGSYNRRDGFFEIENLNEDINDRNRWNVRGQLLWEPTDNLSIRAQADYGRIDESCCLANTLVAGPTAPAVFGVGGQLTTDFFGDSTFLNQVPRNEVDNYGGSIQVDYETGPITITSITAYRELSNFFDQDVDFTSADIVSEIRNQDVQTFTQELRIASDFDGPLNFLLGGFFFDETIDQNSDLTTGAVGREFFELLTPTGPGTFLGVEAGLGLPANSIFSPGPLTTEQYRMENTSWSIFGTVDFEPVDGLVFTAGFNYTDDAKDFALSQTSFDELGAVNLVDAFIVGGIAGATMTPPNQIGPAEIAAFQTAQPDAFAAIAAAALDPGQNQLLGLSAFQFQPPFLNIPNSVEDGRTRDDQLTYTFRVAYDVADEINVYASYATGFKASSVNLSRDSRPAFGDFIPGPGNSTILAPASPILNAGLAVPNLGTGSRVAGPEDAEVWEVGLKGQFEGIGFNLALFDQTIEGFQSFLFTGTGFQLNNAGQQSVRGFEFDATIVPTDGLVFTFATTYLDAVYDEFLESPVGDLSGQPVGGVPEWNIAASGTYTHEFGASGNRLVTRVDYQHESAVNVNNGLPTFNAALGNTQIFRRAVNLVNGSITFQMDNGFEIGGFVRNLFDDRWILTVFDGVAQSGTVSGYPSAPRTFGGLVRYRF
ncbi:TonB-dependent receptor [Alterisphingorhabdus coralli]|uniref:TonB-dependent receptor n=1 Tax=Alterisphingorhabdus coralli TaxID=3071408 RepID=A0AA97F835_9SPHN|nr:TonB-dependent receptor [Parasphingorhabdus sp. SCSIO 66989]WOE76074.1 TonB-dependent receptor [Parasphingorhabdus sp. SCSIO 66989]